MYRNLLACMSFLMLVACASNKADLPRGVGLYEREELGTFLSESRIDQGNEYIISVGDRLDVVFLYHRDLSTKDLTVRSDGRISLPYIGDIMAAGHTPMRLDSMLTSRFEEILREPNLSVIIRSSADKLVYVLGEVQRPGGYPFEVDVSLLQAVALAGGFTGGAKADHSVVIRREGVSRIVGVEVDIEAIMKGDAIQNDFLLRNSDIIYVPKRRLSSVAEFVKAVSEIINPPLSLYLKGWEIRTAGVTYQFFKRSIEE